MCQWQQRLGGRDLGLFVIPGHHFGPAATPLLGVVFRLGLTVGKLGM